MTKNWKVTLPDDFAKRLEDGEFGKDLVLWRPGITCWVTVYGLKEGETPASTYLWLKSRNVDGVVWAFESPDSKPLRLGHLIHEKPSDDPQRWALYTYTVGESGHVMMAIYFDKKEDLELAKRIWFSVSETSP